ncbi:hypothetical protein MMC06_004589 [Schaereria dolodes]|nr:hypothetical protein [Schaereria dolodes]
MTKPHAQEGIDDDRPIAVRRKRRSSAVLINSQIKTHGKEAGLPEQAREVRNNAETPEKPKKRVRFSDPDAESMPESSSTGLTPFVKRTTLKQTGRSTSDSSRFLAKSPRRRLSLPLKSTAASLPSSLPTPPLSGEIQFAPLRQVLGDRVKRRLRRNNLSEEINDINTERKIDAERRLEIHGLKEELALAQQLGNEVVGSTNEAPANAEKIRELEHEICMLKEEMRERSMTVELLGAVGGDNHTSLPFDRNQFDNDADGDIAQTGATNHRESLDGHSQCIEASTQTVLNSSEIHRLQEHARIQASHLHNARLDLEYICPGESIVGLANENGDAKPILVALVDRLRALKTEVLLSESALSTTQTQETNLRTQFNAVLQQLERARNRSEGLDTRNKASSIKLEDAEAELRALETDVIDKETSISKLQRALDTYRVEVKNLESLVTRLEAEHGTALTNLRGEMDEAVADLECHVVAETRGRHEAEAECEGHLLKIKQIEALVEELKGAINEKQHLIREMEEDIEKDKSGKEEEIGRLNVRVGSLTSSLEDVKGDVSKLESEKTLLYAKLVEEKKAGAQVVASMKVEMDKCLERVEEIQESHAKDVQSRGAEVSEHKGLLTPVSAVRFKNAEKCEGYVEIVRGKGRRKRGIDSGIGILEEDEDEDMLGMDM